MEGSAGAEQVESRPRGSRIKRVVLAALMALVTVNVWTGSPLLGLWIGSRVQGSGPPSMAAVAIVALTIAVMSFLLVQVLKRLDAAYATATGRGAAPRQQLPWMRSMRGERPQYADTRPRLSTLDRILVVSVVVVVVLFEVWFFFFSGSPIGTTTGRG